MFTAKRKMQAVLRLLQGEPLDTLSRELKCTAPGFLDSELI